MHGKYERPSLRAGFKVFLPLFCQPKSALVSRASKTLADCKGTASGLVVASAVLCCLEKLKFSIMIPSSLQLGVIKLSYVLNAVVLEITLLQSNLAF